MTTLEEVDRALKPEALDLWARIKGTRAAVEPRRVELCNLRLRLVAEKARTAGPPAPARGAADPVRWRAAVHEAGHAVAALWCELPVARVGIRPAPWVGRGLDGRAEWDADGAAA